MKTTFLLLILFQLKHFFADYPLQTPYMLGKFKSGLAWIIPLLTHVAVHGTFTFLICLFFTNGWKAFNLMLLDMTLHFIMDRIKASPNLLGRFRALSSSEFKCIVNNIQNRNKHIEIELAAQNGIKNLRSNQLFWWSLGFDQMIHHLTHYIIIWSLL